MLEREQWNWEIGQRDVASLADLYAKYATVTEFVVSDDGERIAVPVDKEADNFFVWVNGETWPEEYEKAWHLKFLPNGKLLALLRIDDEWTIGVDGEVWKERFEFAWNPKFTADGSVVAVQTKRDMQYSMCINDKPWDTSFLSMRAFALSPNGQHVAAAVQVEALAEADIQKFLQGTWSLAVDGKAWEKPYLNVYGPTFSPDSSQVAAEIRTSSTEYTLAQDQKAWNSRYSSIWEPVFRAQGGLLAPVRLGADWTLAENDSPIWAGRYVQLWRTTPNPKGDRIAAVVAPKFGQWTICVDDKPWDVLFNDAVLDPIWSDDGQRVAALFRNSGRWGIAVDGQPWSQTFLMAWDPVFSPDGKSVAAKVEVDGKYTLALNGKLVQQRFDTLWDPIFSPRGDAVLLRGIVDNTYQRQVVPVTSFV